MAKRLSALARAQTTPRPVESTNERRCRLFEQRMVLTLAQRKPEGREARGRGVAMFGGWQILQQMHPCIWPYIWKRAQWPDPRAASVLEFPGRFVYASSSRHTVRGRRDLMSVRKADIGSRLFERRADPMVVAMTGDGKGDWTLVFHLSG
ncbi:MAG: hypothetical protein Q9159_007033 [Coniocarpon cinnabarinum]